MDDDGEIIGDVVWEPWSPGDVAERLKNVGVRWYVVAGWALDLFRGEQTRPHEDIEIGVPSASFHSVRDAIDGYEFEVVGSGMRWPLTSPAFDEHFQTWVRDPVTKNYHLDIFRDPHDGDEWIFKRDHSIHRSYEEIIEFDGNGIPYLAPEVTLLFKAKSTREKDDRDFQETLPFLSPEQVSWLRQSLAHVHPEHQWIELLDS